jgi:hypothetical protein
MEAQQIEKEIQKAEGYLKDIKQQIDAEQKRLEKFGSKEAYYDFLAKEKQASNDLEILKSKKRTVIMQEIADKQILPRVKALKDTPMNEEQRIQTVMELALYSAAIGKIKTNFIHFYQVNEVLVEILDENLKLVYGEKKEVIEESLKIGAKDGGILGTGVKERMVLRNPGQLILISLIWPRAKALERENKAKITSSTQPEFVEQVLDDKEPLILESVRKLSLGTPVEIGGKISPQAEALRKRHISGRFEISVMSFFPLVMEQQIKSVLKKYGWE